MNIVFLSNFYNHHQAFISRKLYDLTNGNFHFITTMPVPEAQLKLGYHDLKAPFVLHYGYDEERNEQAKKLINTADILIVGSAPSELLTQRIKDKKIIFRYSEHIFKKRIHPLKFPYQFMRARRENPKGSPIYMLCASSYTASDYAKFGLFKGKCYKWGYFPECKTYDSIAEALSNKKKKEILWCGRFLDWKHPDDVLELAKRLKSDGYDFHINIIGTGEMENELHRMHGKNRLGDCVTFLGTMSPEKVREYMEQSGIYLFTSDHKEGWGAVLNEAMNSGCAVVATDRAGSTGYLIKDGENGLIYRSNDVDMLYNKVRRLLDDSLYQEELGINAYKTIQDEWNANEAAQRFLELATALLNEGAGVDLYNEGPCSLA